MKNTEIIIIKEGVAVPDETAKSISNFPVANIAEAEDKLQIVLEVPGFENQDISIHAINQRIFVSGSRNENYFTKSRRYLQAERIASFRWVYDVKFSFTPQQLKMELQNGLLSINITKSEKVMRPQSERLNVTDFTTENVYFPRANVVETENHYEMSLEIPGYVQSDVVVQMNNNNLIIKGKRSLDLLASNMHYVRIEMPFKNSFLRRFELPENINQQQMSWRVQNGILLVYLPKLQAITEKEFAAHNSIAY